MHPVHVFHQVGDLGGILRRQAVARRIRDIDHRRPRLDHRFDHPGQVFVIRPAGVFGIELDVLDEPFGVLHRRHGPFQHLFAGGVEFIPDMFVGGSDTGVDPPATGIFQGVGGHFDIFLHGTREGADGRLMDRPRNLAHGVEVPGARHRETGLQHVDSEQFELTRHFDLLDRIELTTWHLLTVAQGGIEDI